ncbi:MAG: aminotransferase class IV [Myxococcota bacterium]
MVRRGSAAGKGERGRPERSGGPPAPADPAVAPDRRIWVNGELVPWPEATLHVLSQSAARGSLVFDVMPCYELPDGPAIFGLREHSERFVRSAELSGMQLPLGLDAILQAIAETVRANPGTEIVKINAYHPGISLDVLPIDPEPSIAIAAFAIADVLPGAGSVEPRRLPPARLQVADVRKMPAWVQPPQAKLAAGYLYSSLAKQRARKEGFDDVLLLDERGEIAESSTQSFFLVLEGALWTAPVETVLAGITRCCVLELADDEGFPVKEARLPAERLLEAEEAFLSGTTTSLWPVARIDARTLPPPVPGPLTRRLIERMERLLAGDDPQFSPRWMQRV